MDEKRKMARGMVRRRIKSKGSKGELNESVMKRND